MDKEVKKIRIGIPTGLGTNGVRKEALVMVKAMLKEKTSQPITQQWCKYEIDTTVDNEDIVHFKFRQGGWQHNSFFKWGMVVTAYVTDFEHIKAIMLDFGYDEVIKQIY
jgi:hypothetical protein